MSRPRSCSNKGPDQRDSFLQDEGHAHGACVGFLGIFRRHFVAVSSLAPLQTAETKGMTTGLRRPVVTLFVVCAGVLMVVLDTTTVTVSFPAIGKDLGASEASLTWVINGY